MDKTHSPLRHAFRRVLVGQPFWELWGGRVVATVIMACIVTISMQTLEHSVKELVDTTVQNTLMADMVQDTHALPACKNNELINCISVIGIDNQDFRETFKQTSPLNPNILRGLVDALAAHPPKVVAFDLDLSPASEDEWKARDHLLASLKALARVSRVVMVCPQGFSTTEAGPLDKEWVKRFGPEVQFASPTLSEDGLYYEHNETLSPLGVMATRLAKGEVSSEGATSWLEACAAKPPATDEHQPTEHKSQVIRPSHALAYSFAQAIKKPELFANQLVFIGGKWGINDQFHLRGQIEPVYGVTLHAWVAASELMELKAWPNATMLAFELGIGLLSGFGFSTIWSAIAKSKKRKEHSTGYGLRSCLYVLFLILTVAVPVGWIVVSAHLAKIGIVFGAAGMVLAASADSFLSAHEQPLSNEEEDEEEAGSAHKILRLVSAALVFGAVSAVLLKYGDSIAYAMACGAAVGLFAGAWDRTVPHQPHHTVNDSWFDVAMRVVWLLLKIAALVYMAMHHYENPTRLMLIAFVVTWYATYAWPRKSNTPAAAHHASA